MISRRKFLKGIGTIGAGLGLVKGLRPTTRDTPRVTGDYSFVTKRGQVIAASPPFDIPDIKDKSFTPTPNLSGQITGLTISASDKVKAGDFVYIDANGKAQLYSANSDKTCVGMVGRTSYTPEYGLVITDILTTKRYKWTYNLT